MVPNVKLARDLAPLHVRLVVGQGSSGENDMMQADPAPIPEALSRTRGGTSDRTICRHDDGSSDCRGCSRVAPFLSLSLEKWTSATRSLV